MTNLTTHKSSQRRLLIALMITSTFMIIQLVVASFANSLTVYADAGHLFIHNSSLFIALIASTLAIKFGRTFSDGYHRIELSGGLINGILYLLIALLILSQGIERINHQHFHQENNIDTFLMSSVAALGFLFHGTSALILYKGRKDSVNVYAVFLHTFFDLLSTIITFITSIIIYLTNWDIVDSFASMLIACFVLYTGSRLLYKCIKGLFFNRIRLPPLNKIEKILNNVEHIANIHNLIVKNDNGEVVVGAHIVLKQQCTLEKHDEICRYQVEKALKEQLNINKSVLQIETSDCQH